MKDLIKYILLQVASLMTLLLAAPLVITTFILTGVATLLGSLAYLVFLTHDFFFAVARESQVGSNECTDVRVAVERCFGRGEKNSQEVDAEVPTPNDKPPKALDGENPRSDLVLLEEVAGEAIQLGAQGVWVAEEVAASPFEV